MRYYRVAIQLQQTQTWKWQSTVLTSLDALFRYLRFFSALPQDRIRVYSSSLRESLNGLLAEEKNGMDSSSVTAAQFLQERGIQVRELPRSASEQGTAGQHKGAIAVNTRTPTSESISGEQVLNMQNVSLLERRRAELECGSGGDHDTPYTFSLPPSTPQAIAWARLLARVQAGQLQP